LDFSAASVKHHENAKGVTVTQTAKHQPDAVEQQAREQAVTDEVASFPAHLHFKVTAPRHRPLITHVFVAGDEYLHNDAVFGVKDSLIAEFTEHQGGTSPDGSAPDSRWTQVEFDLVLAREEQP
jgi:protocatechuate 3,4-dioxygenase beta subunit